MAIRIVAHLRSCDGPCEFPTAAATSSSCAGHEARHDCGGRFRTGCRWKCRTLLKAPSGKTDGMRGWWHSHAIAAAPVGFVLRDAWPRPSRISSTTSCRNHRSASGCCRFVLRYGLSLPRSPCSLSKSVSWGSRRSLPSSSAVSACGWGRARIAAVTLVKCFGSARKPQHPSVHCRGFRKHRCLSDWSGLPYLPAWTRRSPGSASR